MCSKPFFPLSVVRHDLIDLIPKGIIMVAAVEVAEFMNNDEVGNARWSHHTLPVEVQRIAFTKACPTVTHVFNALFARLNTHFISVVGNSVTYPLAGVVSA
jgi:hypothetical protein